MSSIYYDNSPLPGYNPELPQRFERNGASAVMRARQRYVARRILAEVSEETGVPIFLLVGQRRSQVIVRVRAEFIRRARAANVGTTAIGRVLKRDPSTINYHIGGYRGRKRVWERALKVRRDGGE